MMYPVKSSKEKYISEIADAIKIIKSGSTILSSGFGLCGFPETCVKELGNHKDIKSLHLVTSNAGPIFQTLLDNKQLEKVTTSICDRKGPFSEAICKGELAVELCPMGTLSERCRAGANGIPAFFTPTGAGSAVEKGEVIARYCPSGSGKPIEYCAKKESRIFNGKRFILETAIDGDVAFIRANKADKLGNCYFRKTASNFNPVFGMNAKYVIVEADEVVEPGEIDPNDIGLQAIFVSVVVRSKIAKRLDIIRFLEPVAQKTESTEYVSCSAKPVKSNQIKIAKRAVEEIPDGAFINLGIGIPSLVSSQIPKSKTVLMHGENGILGMGPLPKDMNEVDLDLGNPSREAATLVKGGACFDTMTSFTIARGGHNHVTMLGALQVSAFGDFASFYLPQSKVMGMGGAMDLVCNPEKSRVILLMEHTDKYGKSKIKAKCNIPLTASRCVSRIITDLAVFDVDLKSNTGLILVELADGVTIEQVISKTEAPFILSPTLQSRLHVATESFIPNSRLLRQEVRRASIASAIAI